MYEDTINSLFPMEKNYELCVLFPGTQTPAEIDDLAKQVETMVAATKADVKIAYGLGRKKLAYAIQGNTHGEYRCWLFSADTETIPSFNEKLRLSPIIIRHLLTALANDLLAKRLQKAQEIKAGKIRDIPEDKEEKKERPGLEPEFKIEKIEKIDTAPGEEKAAIKEKPKLSLDDLDKKLDEILESDKI